MLKIILLLLAFAGATAIAPLARAQALPIGSLTTVGQQYSCANARNGSLFYLGMTCQNATVSCPNAADINMTYGWIAPNNPQGTVVLFSGGAGTSPAGDNDDTPAYAAAYVNRFVVVQFEWNTYAWQDPTNGAGGSILAAGCRPATFLNYINNNSTIHKGAMCAQGESMGTAAIGYSLAWYGANYLTNVELIAGPVASKIDAGCTYAPTAQPPMLCGGSYCTQKTTPWTDPIYYAPGEAATISTWSGLPGVNGTGGVCASSTVNPAYYPT